MKSGKVLNISDIKDSGAGIKTQDRPANPKSNVSVGNLPVIVSSQKPESVEKFLNALSREDVNQEYDIEEIRKQFQENLDDMRAKMEPKKRTTEAKVTTRKTPPVSPARVSNAKSNSKDKEEQASAPAPTPAARGNLNLGRAATTGRRPLMARASSPPTNN